MVSAYESRGSLRARSCANVACAAVRILAETDAEREARLYTAKATMEAALAKKTAALAPGPPAAVAAVAAPAPTALTEVSSTTGGAELVPDASAAVAPVLNAVADTTSLSSDVSSVGITTV